MKIGILALQGCVDAHSRHLTALGVESVLVRNSSALEDESLAGLIIPGGESTTMLKLLHLLEMWEALSVFARSKPLWGVCAGSILMARKVTQPDQESLGLIDMHVERNSYGRQLESFTVPLAGNDEVAFIRAPRICAVGSTVEVLATYKSDPVWVRQGMRLAATFHPELSAMAPSTLHRYFSDLCLEKSQSTISNASTPKDL